MPEIPAKLVKFLPMAYRFAWSRRVTRKGFEQEIAEAKGKGWQKVAELKSHRAHELALLDEEEGTYLTQKLRAKAKRLTVPLPPLRDEKGEESEFWQHGFQTGEWSLTMKGRRVVEDDIRREKKARHEDKLRWFAWVGVLGGIVGFLSAAFTFWKNM